MSDESPESISARKSDFSEWFHQVIKVADIIDQRYPLQGFLVYKPYGYEILDRSLRILEELLVKTGHKKCYFPALIPEKLLKKEEHHIQGFSEEVFWVTKAGKRDLNEIAALRPTSETAMYEMLSLWIRSWRDLPMKIHQSTSVFRYETKHTRPLIRDREILWNEAHTSHATAEEAENQMRTGIEIYGELFEKLAIPVVFVNVADVFAGAVAAVEPYTIFPDGRVIEMGSVNNLGQRFSRAFNISFSREDGSRDFAYQTCYGVSERLLAAMVAIHGDDKGIVLPPSIAPVQIVVVPIIFEKEKKKVKEKSEDIFRKLSRKFRVHLDGREISAGSKFYDWELRGVPLRIEIGPKDIARNSVTVSRRDTGKKESLSESKLESELEKLLEQVQQDICKKAHKYFQERTAEASSASDINKIIGSRRLAKIAWCGSSECASKMEKEADASFLGSEYGGQKPSAKCICGKQAASFGFIGKSY